MIIKSVNFSISQLFCLGCYYGFAIYLPQSNFPFLGFIARKIRYYLVRKIFKKCGENVNIERGANFGSGHLIEIGNNSGIGIRCTIPGNTIIGENVMMGPNCYILGHNHIFDSKDIPMCFQGKTLRKQTIIEDDVWIGRDVKMTPGRTIKKGSIVAMGCILTKDFPAYSIIGGNPSKLIKSRI